MFSNDRFMTMATGLVLAIAVGSIAQNSGFIGSLISGEDPSASHDDQYTINAGRNQLLDVLANDTSTGDITIVEYPSCGSLRAGENNTLEFYGSEMCSGNIAFSYCVPTEGNCEAQQVALNVINLQLDTTETTTKIATATVEPAPSPQPSAVAATPAPAQSATTPLPSVDTVPISEAKQPPVRLATPTPVLKPTTVATPTVQLVEILPEEQPESAKSAPTQTASATTASVTQGDRLTAGKIVMEDDSNDIAMVGFGAAAPSSLYSPNMNELIQPQETVATLRRSVEAIAPSRITQDQNIATQTSAATPSTVETANSSITNGEILGTEPSPLVFFTSPSQPRLSPTPMLAPISSNTQPAQTIELGPVLMSNTPKALANVSSDEQDIQTPDESGFSTRVAEIVAMIMPSGEKAVKSDKTVAQVGDVMIATNASNTIYNDTSTKSSQFASSMGAGTPTTSASPVLVASAETVLPSANLNVNSASPSSFAYKDNSIDNLFASISVSDNYEAAAAKETDTKFGSLATPDSVGNVDNRTARVASINTLPSTMIDASDVVTEMAAQIILPGPQLNDSMTRVVANTPLNQALMSDQLFTPNLETSSPPPKAPPKVASLAPISPVITRTDVSGTAQCDVRMSTSARPGAEIAIYVSSRCRPNQIVTISHAGFSFAGRTDRRGTLSANVPAFTSVADIEVVFEDGTSQTAIIESPDATDIERFAIVWSVPVNLDLHAFESGAKQGSGGHVSINNQRTYRDTLTGGGGYLEIYGDPTIAGGAMAEVYSLPTNRIRRETSVDLDLRISNIDAYCDKSMVLRTIRSEDDEANMREFSMKLPKCGTASGGLVLESFVDPINVASR